LPLRILILQHHNTMRRDEANADAIYHYLNHEYPLVNYGIVKPICDDVTGEYGSIVA